MTPATLTMRRGRILLLTALCTACCLSTLEERAAAQRLFGLGDRSVTYRLFRDPGGRFDLEYPTRDWRQLPSAGANLVMFARNDGATVAIDYLRLEAPLAASQVPAMAEFEIGDLKVRHPQAKDFTTEIKDTKAGRGALIRYGRVGTSGPERVMQFSIPNGMDLYRVIAIVPEMLLAKYEVVLMHMIESFHAPAGSAAAKP
jgi:hypothetical protein